MRYTAHVDRFAEERLPAPEAMPELRFESPELWYPERLNAATQLLDRHVACGDGGRRCILAPGGPQWTYAELQQTANRIAHVLRDDLGLEAGNRVLLRAPNSPM